MKKALSFTVLFVLVSVSTRFASGADWKFFSASSNDYIAGLWFYDAETVKSLPYGHIQVWAKVADQQSIDAILDNGLKDKSKSKGSIIKKTEKAVRERYIPPFCMVSKDIDYDTCLGIALSEEAASDLGAQTIRQALYEIDCKEQMIQTVSSRSYDRHGNRRESVNKKDTFSYIAPESSADWLMKILCEK
jgi:hypothetical protein